MKEIGHIYLSWREGLGKRRHIVGVLKRNATLGVRFSYIKDGVEAAKKDGFSPYTEFPDFDKEYTENVLEVFGQRIMKSERSDISDFYDFWEIDTKYKDDKFLIRKWLCLSLLKGVFGSQSDTVLMSIKKAEEKIVLIPVKIDM